MSTAQLLLRIAIAFAAGSIPFSFLMVKLLVRDIRAFGEGNPCSASAFREGGLKAGIPSIIFDSFKGVFPVAFLVKEAPEYQLSLIAISPLLGHALPPFLRMKEGKAIVTSFGIWTAQAVWTVPTDMGIGALASMLLFKESGDCAKLLIVFVSLAASLAISGAGLNMWSLFVTSFAAVAFKHAQYAAMAQMKP